MPSTEKDNLINDIKRLMNPIPQRRYSYDSLTTHKIIDKLFMRLGLILIIGLLGFIAIKTVSKDKERCPTGIGYEHPRPYRYRLE